MKKLVSLFHSLLIGPLTFMLGLLLVLFITLAGVNRLVEVDAMGRPLLKNETASARNPITSQIIEVTSTHGWDKDPEKVMKFDQLTESIHHRQADSTETAMLNLEVE